jgi:tRNA pseudouridine13 synthase
VGVAGLKDKRAVTTQTISIPVPPKENATFDQRCEALQLPGIEILQAKRHGNKLKTGHLAGNRFDLVVRNIAADELDRAMAMLRLVGREGLPNAYGAQRFGRDRDNAERALAWLQGKEQGPRDPKARRFLWSALQSAIFNDTLALRLENGTWNQALAGDLLQRTGATSCFLCTEVEAERERADRGEVSPTGPMPGVSMRWPEGEPGIWERALAEKRLGVDFDWDKTKALGEGARRPLRVPLTDLQLEVLPPGLPEDVREVGPGKNAAGGEGSALRVRFMLPRGCYATTVLSTAFRLEDMDRRSEASEDHEASKESG